MINTNVDQLLKLTVPRSDGGTYAADEPTRGRPPFDTHLRRAGPDALPAPVKPSPQAETTQRDSQRGSSTDAKPAADRPTETNAAPPAQSSTARESNEASQRDDDAKGREDTEQTKPDETADAAAVAGDQAANTDRAEADAAADGGTPRSEELLAKHTARPLESADPQTGGSAERSVETRDVTTTTKDDAPDADGLINPELPVRPAADAKSAPAIAGQTTAEVSITAGGGEAAKTDPTSKPEAQLTRGKQADVAETSTAADELAAVDVDATEADEEQVGTGNRRRGRSQRETDSVEREGRQNSSRHTGRTGARPATSEAVAVELAAEHAASTAAEGEHEQSAAHTGPNADDSGQRDEASTESRPHSGRSRSVAAARTAAAHGLAVPSAAAKLPEAGRPLPIDAVSKPNAQQTDEGAKENLLTTFSRFDRHGNFAARGAHRAADGQEMPHVDPARFISRVARAIHTAHERGGPLQLRLSPPELGALRLELSVKQGVLTANVETDNATARQVLLDNLPALRDRLAEQNVRIERFDVDVRRDGGEQPNLGPQHRDHQQPRHSAPPDRAAISHGASGDDTAADAAPVRRTITDTSINVIA